MKSFLTWANTLSAAEALAFIIIIGGGCMIAFCKLSDSTENRTFDVIMLVAAYYFGSSKGSQGKDKTISDMASNSSGAVIQDSTVVTTK